MGMDVRCLGNLISLAMWSLQAVPCGLWLDLVEIYLLKIPSATVHTAQLEILHTNYHFTHQMSDPSVPIRYVTASVAVYSLAHGLLSRHVAPDSRKLLLKGISGAHAAAMTLVATLALNKSPLRLRSEQTGYAAPKYGLDDNLDDRHNPIIQEQSDLANAITAWETGYLLFDTWGILRYASRESSPPRLLKSAMTAAKVEPFEFAHHTGLATALLCLQYYIWKGNERGVWIIVALTLMNASTPLYQLRGFVAHRGRRFKALDVSFAVAFALSRMGTIYWILQRYGAYHGLNAWAAYRKLRLPCQAGTGAIFSLNTVWWLLLLRSIRRRHMS